MVMAYSSRKPKIRDNIESTYRLREIVCRSVVCRSFNLEIKVPESGGRMERHKWLEVQCEVSTVGDDLRSHVIFW